MLESLSPCIPAKSAAHLPENWKEKTRVHSVTHDHLGLIGKINTHNREPPVSTQRLDLDDNLDDIILDTKSNLHQWNDVFGSHSGKYLPMNVFAFTLASFGESFGAEYYLIVFFLFRSLVNMRG